jgi:two-component system, NtrC family, nitrogen regulation sensor histidine kinase NtrY
MRLGLQGKAIAGLLTVALVPLLVALLLVREITNAAERVAAGEAERLHEPLERARNAYREAVAARKEQFHAGANLIAHDPDILRQCERADGAELKALLDRLLAHDPLLGRIALEINGSERAAAERHFAEPMKPLELDLPVSPSNNCVLHLRYGFRAQLLEDQQVIAESLRERRFLARVHRTLPGSYWTAFALLFGGVVFAVTVIAIVVARRTSRRIARLAHATARVAEGDLEARVDVPGADELAELGQAFNRMVADLRRSRVEIEYLQKIGAWQEVARRLAHEIKNPLTPIQLAVQQLASKYAGDDPRFRKMLADASEIVTEEVAGLRRLVDAFSGFAKLPRVEPQKLDLAVVIDDVARDAPQVELARPASPVRVAADRMLLRRALVNLVDNAREAGATHVRIGWSEGEGGARVLVDDDGPGVDANVAARIFDPYVTTKEHGTGLGLAIVKKTMLEHGGDVVLDHARSPLGGARFVLTLPPSTPSP